MIVRAQTIHLKQIVEIEHSSFRKPWSENDFKKDITNSASINFVYLHESNVIGYIFGLHIIDEYHLFNLAVKKIHRKNRIAIKLFKYLEQYLKNIKVKTVLLEVSTSNLPALNLYKKVGFIRNGQRKNYYANGDDAILMYWSFNDRMV